MHFHARQVVLKCRFTTMRNGWNHNTHYYDHVVRCIPKGCARALDVGCGEGELARRMAAVCEEVAGIDTVRPGLAASGYACKRLRFLEGDVMTFPLPLASFNFIAAVASLHHLPLRPALVRLRELLAPGGVLVIIGLYRTTTLQDWGWTAIGRVASVCFRCRRKYQKVCTPQCEPREALSEIQAVSQELLPGSRLKRLLLLRYSIVWKSSDLLQHGPGGTTGHVSN